MSAFYTGRNGLVSTYLQDSVAQLQQVLQEGLAVRLSPCCYMYYVGQGAPWLMVDVAVLPGCCPGGPSWTVLLLDCVRGLIYPARVFLWTWQGFIAPVWVFL